MHALMLSSRPPLLYWNQATLEAIHVVRGLRAEGVPVFFTIDAGPQVKAVCEVAALKKVKEKLRTIPGVQRVMESGLGPGAYLLEEKT
jgi:diphosphomevalonate decarboxylase